MKDLTVKKIQEGLLSKKFSAVELAKEYLKRIKKEDKKISSFVTITEDLALERAKEADKLISEKKASALTGVPIAVKDNILVKGEKCTCSSKILENYKAPYSATVVERLKGMVILGKTNLDEFAMGSSTENSAFFATKNPHDLKRVPGGSSGGSAAAVAADLAPVALGSDTGGSIRQPASFCGVVGLKPTYGAVSRYGLVAFASSLDQIGPIAKNAQDAQIIFNAISGKDPKDSTSVEYKIKNIKLKIEDLTIGVPKEYFVEGINTEVKKIIKEAVKKIEKKGAKIKEISLPHTKYAIPAYYLIATPEASSNLARFDGIKYGLSKAEESLIDVYLKTKAQGFGAEVKRRIMLGTYALSAGYYDAFYLKAQKVRTLIKKDFDRVFSKVDFVFTPVAPTAAFKIGEKTDNPLEMYLADIFTVSASLAGLPAVSVPVGFAGKLPVGLQILGRPFEENNILELCKNF
jgi:aspartyl-tRNA(Asn)/glutamyl-tRNA(Gln) amidotransferase subunit A